MTNEERMQQYLPLLRTCAGWTAKDLADQLEVSRQSISAWENYDYKNKKGVKLSKIQYLAIKKLLEDEIDKDTTDENSEKRHILGTLLEVLIDHPDSYTTDDRKAVLEKAKLLAPAIMKEPEQRKSISRVWPMLLVGCGVALSAAILAIIGLNNKEGEVKNV
jgi:DNA-binding XRE family transcriptional regulator